MFKIPTRNLKAVHKLADELFWDISQIEEFEQLISAALFGDDTEVSPSHKLLGVVTRMNMSDPPRPLAAFSDITSAHRVKDHLMREAHETGEMSLYKVDLVNLDLELALWLGDDA